MSRLRDMAELVLRDLTDRSGRQPILTVSGPGADGTALVSLADGTGMVCGFGVDPAASDVRILHTMAYRIPDAYVELFSVGLPLVPGTQRPAVPKITADGVLWVDPSGTSTWSCPVGRYAQAGGAAFGEGAG